MSTHTQLLSEHLTRINSGSIEQAGLSYRAPRLGSEDHGAAIAQARADSPIDAHLPGRGIILSAPDLDTAVTDAEAMAGAMVRAHRAAGAGAHAR